MKNFNTLLGMFAITVLSLNLQAQYCLPTYNSQCTSGDFINSFSLNLINNSGTGCGNPSVNNYTDFTSLQDELEIGQTYTVSCSPGPSWGQYFVLWIDFDQNNDFGGTNEFFDIGYASAGGSISNTITIPAGVSSGVTRMRVLCRFSTGPLSSTDYCATGLSWGECEDYSVNILAGCEIPITCPANITVNNDPGVCGAVVNFGEPGCTNPSVDGYTVEAIPFAPVAGSGTAIPGADDNVIGPLPVGFNFNFYGNDYSSFYVSTNGFLTFNSGSTSGCCTGQFLPSVGNPNNLIALAWEDLVTASGVTEYFTSGIAPNRILVVNFIGVRHFGSADNLTFQALLYEGSNIIEIHTTSMIGDGGSHTMGVENIDGTQAVTVPGRNSANWSATNDGQRFVPAGSGCYDCLDVSYSISSGLPGGSAFPVGTTVNTFIANSGSGASGTCTFSVTVNDSELPNPVCQTFSATLGAGGTVSVVATDLIASPNDNCGIVSYMLSGTTDYTCDDLGNTYTVGVTAVDAAGNMGSCDASVNLIDPFGNCCSPPNAVCQDLSVELDATGTAFIMLEDIDGGTDLGCLEGIGFITLSQEQFSCADAGVTIPVTLSILEDVGDGFFDVADDCVANITVSDNIAPVIECPDPVSVATDPGFSTAVVTYTLPVCPAPVSSGEYDLESIPFSPIAGSGTAVNLSDDELSAPLPIGFDFNFFGINYSNFYISSNGFISFTLPFSSGCCEGDFLPSSDSPNNLIALAWTDLNPEDGGVIEYFTSGVAPNRSLIINFTSIPRCCGYFDNALTAQLILNEASNIIEIHTLTKSDLTSLSTMGIENADGTEAVTVPGRNSADWSASSDAWRFSPAVSGGPAACDNCPDAFVNLTSGLGSGAAFPIGTTTEEYTATDPSGNMGTCSFTITVGDGDPPQITCPEDQVYTNLTGECYADAHYDAPIGTDAQPGAITVLTAGIPHTGYFPVGVTTNTYAVTDASGNTASCSFTVTVNDTEAPDLACPANIAVIAESGSCGSIVEYAAPEAFENCLGGLEPLLLFEDFESGAPGWTTGSEESTCSGNSTGGLNTWQLSSTSGGTAPISLGSTWYGSPNNGDEFGAERSYIQSPELIVDGSFVQITFDSYSSNESGYPCSYDVEHIQVSINGSPFEDVHGELPGLHSGEDQQVRTFIFFVETTPGDLVQFRFLYDTGDNCCSGDEITGWYIDNVSITQTPAILSSNTLLSEDFESGAAGWSLGADDITCSSNSTGSQNNWILTPETGGTSPFTLGSTWYGVPNNGSQFGAERSYVTSPSFTVNSNVISIAFDSYTSNESGYPCDYDVEIIQLSLNAGPFVNLDNFEGILNGSSSDQTIRSITADIIVSPGDNVQLRFLYDTGDNIGGPIDIVGWYVDNILVTEAVYETTSPEVFIEQISGFASGETFPVGVTTNTYEIEDEAGGLATCSFNVTVYDFESPDISCPMNSIVPASEACAGTIEFELPTATDNCEEGLMVNQIGGPLGGTEQTLGTYTLTWQATDASGNSDYCTFNVTVADNDVPEITCPEDVTVNATSGACGANVLYSLPVATDNCGIISLVQTEGLGLYAFFPVGTTPNTWVATDYSGKSSQCSFDVTVVDDQPPVLECEDLLVTANTPDGQSASLVLFAPSATDNCGVVGTPTNSINGSSNVGVIISGSSPLSLTWSVMDVNGNIGSCVQTVTVNSCLPPTGLTSTILSPTKASVSWSPVAGALGYRVRGRVLGTTPFASVITTNTTRTLTGLTPGQSYEWQVQARCSLESISDFSPFATFTMPSTRIQEGDASLDLYPNPAAEHLTAAIEMNAEEEVVIRLVNTVGAVLEVRTQSLQAGPNSLDFNVGDLAAGVYYIEVHGLQTSLVKRFVISR